MRPHTRTQCQDSTKCSQCTEVIPSAEAAYFAVPSSSSSSVRGGRSQQSQAPSVHRHILIVELPAELLVKIINYMSFKEISNLRLVSRRFNEICASMLNGAFQKFQSLMLQRFQEIKNKMPRRESARRNHPLARESDIVETLHMRLTLLQMTFGKHVERKHVCFFPGEILDEVQRIQLYIKQTPNLGRAYKVTDELFDLSTMAMEYFKDYIEPTLPEITYFGTEFLDFTTPFSDDAPPSSKRRSTSGTTSVDSPCSSRASLAGSSCSEPWSGLASAGTNAGGATEATNDSPGSNMVLRKRIRKIRQGMKRYNDQLVEVKRELKSCKTKMETQTKQVNEYSQRLEDYDKKFEESSRKFQTLLTELNKCKTELQFWRSKSTGLLASSFSSAASASSSAGHSPSAHNAQGSNAACTQCCETANLSDIDPEVASVASEASSIDLKTLANQGVFPDQGADHDMLTPADVLSGPTSPRPVTRGSVGGPPSPGTNSRKRAMAPSPVASATASVAGEETTRKSLRNGCTRSASKRPKLATNN